MDLQCVFHWFLYEVYNLATEAVGALAKPIIDVASLEPYEENHESGVAQARVANQEGITRKM